ncbi:nuclear factor interleukin-3-regulated protein-like [Clarias magur]|uniref:Nuclear factor interleukin-3-regulated protein-like n=1 Tax=Clarias magur TaxID=1594786 RepID=A0A8J4XCN3_CLAMG|nr:nuclear factor interleukin-3-regulated protein-like [Clarias magur]
MSSSACCSARDANAYECHWNCAHGFECDLSVNANVPTRRKREFTPDELKDDTYWMKRSRNNEAAKRSRERRRLEERLLEERARHLFRENEELKAALSAISYCGAGKETTYDALNDCSPVWGLSRDSYLVSFPGARRMPHYALCDLGPRMHGIPAAVGNTPQTDRYLGFHMSGDGNVPLNAYSAVPYARKWGQVHAHPDMNLYPNPAAFSLNETVPRYRCPAGAAHTRMNGTYVDQRSFVSAEPKETEIVKETERVPGPPLLPHKLRYKVHKARGAGESARTSAGNTH